MTDVFIRYRRCLAALAARFLDNHLVEDAKNGFLTPALGSILGNRSTKAPQMRQALVLVTFQTLRPTRGTFPKPSFLRARIRGPRRPCPPPSAWPLVVFNDAFELGVVMAGLDRKWTRELRIASDLPIESCTVSMHSGFAHSGTGGVHPSRSRSAHPTITPYFRLKQVWPRSRLPPVIDCLSLRVRSSAKRE